MIGIVLVVLLVLILLGGTGVVGGLPYGYGAGHYGVGGIGLVIVILLILLLLGKI
jgi:hypothetical protein